MSSTILQQGKFVSDGGAKDLNIRSDVDFLRVFNFTVAGTDQTTAIGVEYFWQRGMDIDSGVEYKKSNSANAENLVKALTTGGFTLLDTSEDTPGILKTTITAVSNAAIPVVTNTGTNAISAGDIVRLIDVDGASQISGMDFSVGGNTLSNTTFSLDFMSQIAAGTTGSWRVIKFDPQFYPSKRFITKISKAQKAVVTLSVEHGLEVGQSIRLSVPKSFGMKEMNGLLGNILSIDNIENTITLDIDSSTFSSFVFPVDADSPFARAEIVPVGMASIESNAGISTGATDNISFIGMRLAAGIDSPAGLENDVIYWHAGKSTSVTNE